MQLLLAAAVRCWAQADSLVKAKGNQLVVLAIRQQVCQILESGGDVIVVVVLVM